MSPNTLYHLTVEGTDIIVRLRGDLVDREKLVKLLDSLERESIREQCMRREKYVSAMPQHLNLHQRT